MRHGRRMTSMVLGSLLGIATVTGLSACQGPYVNIPAESGDVATHDSNGSLVREVETKGLQEAVKQLSPQGSVMVVLPQGTSKLTYAAVLPKVSDQAIAPNEENANPATTLTVKGVRVRGLLGQVDVGYKSGEGPEQLLTVSLKWGTFSGWDVTDTRMWTFPVDK